MSLRITGLVKFTNWVKKSLQAGIPPHEHTAFRHKVQQIIRQVEQICRDHSTIPARLPRPSQNAYQYLKSLDLHKLPTSESAPEQKQPKKISLKNARSTADHFAEKFWQELDSLISSEQHKQKFQHELAKEAAQIEAICKRRNIIPGQLTENSRQLYCWLKFLAVPENFDQHTNALSLAKNIFLEQENYGLPMPLVIKMINMKSVYRSKLFQNQFLIQCHESFINADKQVWEAAFNSIFGHQKRRKSKQTVRAFIESEAYSSIVFEMAAFAEPPAAFAVGKAHDLNASFERVNQQYFQGKMAKPSLIWSQTLTTRKMGHYQGSRDTVMISRSLDHPEVPKWVIDFVMYHELLHKKHGAKVMNGRRYAHTSAFRKDEKKFERYQEADDFLNSWARQLSKI